MLRAIHFLPHNNVTHISHKPGSLPSSLLLGPPHTQVVAASSLQGHCGHCLTGLTRTPDFLSISPTLKTCHLYLLILFSFETMFFKIISL